MISVNRMKPPQWLRESFDGNTTVTLICGCCEGRMFFHNGYIYIACPHDGCRQQHIIFPIPQEKSPDHQGK